MLLAFGVLTSACGGADSSIPTGPSSGPSGPSVTRGTLVVSTVTTGEFPNVDGYLLVIDSTAHFSLRPTGTATLVAPTGHHTLRLRDVPQSCSVVSDTVLDVVVAPADTIAVHFATTCPVPRGYARITVLTTGSPATPGPYDVVYGHSDAWDGIGADGGKLGELSPGSALVVYLPASTNTGDDPYLYGFWIDPVPSNCRADITSQYKITAQDTVDVALTLACTP